MCKNNLRTVLCSSSEKFKNIEAQKKLGIFIKRVHLLISFHIGHRICGYEIDNVSQLSTLTSRFNGILLARCAPSSN